MNSLPVIIRLFQLRKLRWEGRVTQMGEDECVEVIHGNGRRKETTRKTKTWVGGYY
jgi:hypothetical protein